MSDDAPTVAALVAAKLAESGLTPADGKRLGMRWLTAAETRKLDPTFLTYPALRLAYHDFTGRPTGFYRIRYLGDLNGFDALRKKLPRYVQPSDTTSEVYYPAAVGHDWAHLAADASVALFITEGELKAACACKAGYPTLGLGGVWSWKSAKRGLPFLPSLTAFAWRDRFVYLVFDSDFASKPDVMRALVALARELTLLGALPHLVTLPDVYEDGRKTGLDDYLVARSPEEFDLLVREAVAFNEAKELWALNEEVMYVRDPGLVVVLADGRRISAGAFKEHAYSDRRYHVNEVNAKGDTRFVEKPLAPAWLEWPCRAVAGKLTYEPGSPRLSAGNFNTWRGWGVAAKRGDVGPWTELLAYLFKGEPNARAWFERWCAYPLQHPGAKLYVTAVVWGATHGTGKSLVGYTLGRIYGSNFSEIGDEDLRGSFNEWAQHKQFVLADEVTASEYKRDLMERIKKLITRETIRINAKFLPTYELRDCLNYYFTSNHPDAFVIDDLDRRYFVHQAPTEALPDEFYTRYDAWYRSREGAAALFDHLLRLPLGDFNPRAKAPMTDAKAAMIRDSKSDLGAWVAKLREAPDTVLRFGDAAIEADLFTNDQLLALYDPERRGRVTANGLGRELKKAGFAQVRGGATVATAKGPLRLYAVRRPDRWLETAPTLIAAHWNAAFGGSAATKRAPKEKY